MTKARQLSKLLGGSVPSALDTLNEISTALGNDADLATTLTNAIGTKAQGVAAFQALNLDTVKTPGLYQYDGAFTGTKPPDNAGNYRTIEIGSSSRYTQIAFTWNSNAVWIRRKTDSSWTSWVQVPISSADLISALGYTPLSNADGAVTSSKLAAGAAVANIGYTPINKAGDTLNGSAVMRHGNLSTTVVRIPYDSFSGVRSWKIGAIASWYWGTGGTILEVWRDGYSSFAYSKYLIVGHTRTNYGPGMAINTLINGGGAVPYLGTLTAVNSEYGYHNILLDDGSYWSYVIRITTPMDLQRGSNPPYTNSVYAYPDGSY